MGMRPNKVSQINTTVWQVKWDLVTEQVTQTRHPKKWLKPGMKLKHKNWIKKWSHLVVFSPWDTFLLNVILSHSLPASGNTLKIKTWLQLLQKMSGKWTSSFQTIFCRKSLFRVPLGLSRIPSMFRFKLSEFLKQTTKHDTLCSLHAKGETHSRMATGWEPVIRTLLANIKTQPMILKSRSDSKRT